MRSFAAGNLVARRFVSVSASTPMAYFSTAFASTNTRLFTKSHEWVEFDDAAKTAVLGLSNHAIKELNDITFVDFPAVGTAIEQDAPICSIESVKAVVDFKAPCTGTIAEFNTTYEDVANLAKLKDGGAETAEGWFFKVKDVAVDKSKLMTEAEFEKFCSE